MSSVFAGLSGCDGFFRMLLNDSDMMATRESFAASPFGCPRVRAQVFVRVRPATAAAPMRNSRRLMRPPPSTKR